MAWPFRRRAITAAVSVVPNDRKMPALNTYADAQEWQARAWEMYRTIGEVRYAARYVGNSLSRVRFFVGTRERPGDPVVPIEDDATGDEAIARDQLRRLRGSAGTFASLVRTYGIQQFIAGETFLVARDGVMGERWEFITAVERRKREERDMAVRSTDPDAPPPLAGATIFKFWTPDPMESDQPDSAMRSVLDICQNLRAAQAMQTAGDYSRLAGAGILWLPADAGLKRTPEGRLKFAEDLMDAAEMAMEDPGSVAASLPIFAEMKGEHITEVDRTTFERAVDEKLTERIEYLIRRLGQGLDIPVERITGIGDLNHWDAWEVAEETIHAHISPLAGALAEDLTAGILIPSLQALRIRDPERFAVGHDETDLVVSPDRDDNARWAHDKLLLDDDTTLRALGFDPDQRPDDDELRRRLQIIQAMLPGNYSPFPTGAEPTTQRPSEPPPPIEKGPPPAGPPDGQPEPAGPPAGNGARAGAGTQPPR